MTTVRTYLEGCDARALHDAAMAAMLVRHPTLRERPDLIQRAYNELYEVLRDVELGAAIEAIGKRAMQLYADAPTVH